MAADSANASDAPLPRRLNLPLLSLYGLGNILGAGIYVLIGKVAGEAGYWAPVAFLFASLIAAFTAFTYAELGARFPVSAGEAVYLFKAFQLRHLSLLVGLLIVLSGTVSAAAICQGFAGYLGVFVDLPNTLVIIVLLLVLGGLAIWGIQESVTIAAAFTLIEIFGLLFICYVSKDSLGNFPDVIEQLPSFTSFSTLTAILSASFLAFYAYIGFEDMVNVAEEVKEPERNMPRAVIISLVVSSLLYALVAFLAILVISPAELGASEAPLASVYEKATGEKPWLISVISLFAVINGALIQIIMGSRILYGMADNGWLPSFLAKVNPVTRTPAVATLVIISMEIVFALMIPLVKLAEITSLLILTIFVLVNLALVKIKLTETEPFAVSYPLWVPLTGVVTSFLFVFLKLLLT